MLEGKNKVIDPGMVTRTVDIKKDGENALSLYIPEDSVATLSEDTKLLAETRAAGTALLWNGGAAASTTAYSDAVSAYASGGDASYVPYVSLGGFSLRNETGSYVDTKGLTANLGFVKRWEAEKHTDTLMPFFEYGASNYTSHLDDGARADGKQHYIGGGVLLRRDNTDGLHYEAMVRAGRLHGDFAGIMEGYHSSYNSNAPYLAAHAGIGKLFKQKDNSVDVYGKFFWTHLGSDSATIHNSLGQAQYDFAAVNSYRTRLGVRYTKNQPYHSAFYAGLGWDYEFDGEAKASYRNFNTPSPSTKGSSGFVELGWQSAVSKDNPWGADVRVTGWTGRQRGVTYSATISRRI